jgi:hypothetical protein
VAFGGLRAYGASKDLASIKMGAKGGGELMPFIGLLCSRMPRGRVGARVHKGKGANGNSVQLVSALYLRQSFY